ncbi:MAG: DNA/RNA endonuclease G [Calditrichaeota bacterium]|jgi:endonuclease G, mitochondrial|nr:DNA/RNA endonuclease G [Calditrichota bacterium]MBT7616375.1 DNA/RNA endonuclease G [Calditrichota bacterium]MBT7788327.1 DNA/RNA endonuclease G [Calditrichota bacterium]
MNLPNMRREMRYGIPAADQIVFNRHYVLGYSYYFRQAKWALEIVSPNNPDVERKNPFRADYRIPEMFRADLIDYEGSGFDRGHLVASADKEETELQNSETFLLSNMSPQKPEFNQGIWKNLESEVRELNDHKKVFETYVICGPLFNFAEAVQVIGADDSNKVSIPIPHAYFKSILTERNTGTIYMWSFIMPNKESDEPLSSFLVPTEKVERFAGIKLWDQLVGTKFDNMRKRVKKMW